MTSSDMSTTIIVVTLILSITAYQIARTIMTRGRK